MSTSADSTPGIVSRTTLHVGRKFSYEQIEVRGGSGKTHTRQYVKHPGAVVIVPVIESATGQEVVLIRVYRAALDQMSWELCAGTIDRKPDGTPEDPAVCAGRELIEETGYKPGRLTPIATFHTSPGLSDEVMHAFLATDLTHVGQHLEEDEDIQVRVVPAGVALSMLQTGELRDGKSMVALMIAARQGHLRDDAR
jgi:ADP-ribose pyrophosphatase